MNETEFLKRKIFLKTQLVELTQLEIAELEKELDTLKEKRGGDQDGE